MYNTNGNTIQEIALQDIKLKIQASFFMLLDNLKSVKSASFWNIPYPKDSHLELVENELINCIANFDSLSKNDSSIRDEQIYKFGNLKKNVVNISESMHCYIYHNYQLKNIADKYSQIHVLKGTGTEVDPSESISDSYNEHLKFLLDSKFMKFMDNNDMNSNKISLFISSMPLKMTRERYSNYIKASIEIMLENANEAFAEDLFRRLKLEFSPSNMPEYGLYYKEIGNKLETISNLNIENFDYNELLEVCDSLEDTAEICSGIQDYLTTMHESLNYIGYILGFSDSIDFIIGENLIYKDIFYTWKNSLNNDSEELNEQLEGLLSEVSENLVDSIADLKSDINRALKKTKEISLSESTLNILGVREFITDLYYETLSDVVYPIRLPSDENTTLDKEFLESKTNEFLDYIKESTEKLSTKNKRLIKQKFLENLIIPFDAEEFKEYFNYILDNSNEHEKLIMLQILDDMQGIDHEYESENIDEVTPHTTSIADQPFRRG